MISSTRSIVRNIVLIDAGYKFCWGHVHRLPDGSFVILTIVQRVLYAESVHKYCAASRCQADFVLAFAAGVRYPHPFLLKRCALFLFLTSPCFLCLSFAQTATTRFHLLILTVVGRS
jgi:hypothetical protein